MWWIAHIFQILNNMYNWGMSLALTQMVVICGVCLGHGHYILYVWDRNCEMSIFFGWRRYILYECVVKWLWLGTTCWITRHPFIFYNKFTQLFNIFFLTVSRCAQDRFKITIQSKYWSHFIKYGESVLASSWWYINVVSIHEGVFRPSDALNVQNHQSQHVLIKAKRIFDLCYHADKYTSFVITNHKSLLHMNGCHGKNVCYDSLRQQYNVLITSNNAKQSEGNITLLSPSVMEPTYVFWGRKHSSCYQLSRCDSKISTTKVIQLELPKPSCAEPISTLQDNEVKKISMTFLSWPGECTFTQNKLLMDLQRYYCWKSWKKQRMNMWLNLQR